MASAAKSKSTKAKPVTSSKKAKATVKKNRGRKVPTSLRDKPSPQALGRVATKIKFLEGMVQFGSIRRSCNYAGMSYTVYYYWTDNTGKYADGKYYDEEFVHEVALAKEAYRDVLRETAHMRAVDGVEKPVFGSLGHHEGTGVVGHVREYSDRILEKLMQWNLPEAQRAEGQGHPGAQVYVDNRQVHQTTNLGFDIKALPLDLKVKMLNVLREIEEWQRTEAHGALPSTSEATGADNKVVATQ